MQHYTRTALVAALTTMVAPSSGDVAAPELFTMLGTLGTLDAHMQYVIYDLEEAGGTLVPSDDLVDQLVAATQDDQQLANWSGDQPNSMGYGSVRPLAMPAGTGLAITMAGSSMSSAATVWVVPVTAKYPAVNSAD
jgi:hypothetical protein